MRQKTQTDRTRPTLCHARERGFGGEGGTSSDRCDGAGSDAVREGAARRTREAQAPSGLHGVKEALGEGAAARANDAPRAVDNRATPRTPVRASPWPGADNFSGRGGSKDVGAAFETRALVFLQRQRLRFVARNVACRGGEIDLVMRDRDGALVFVEVRARARRQFGGAAASIGWQKRQRLVRAAQYYLLTRVSDVPACRFDVIAFEGGRLVWLRDAFRVDEV